MKQISLFLAAAILACWNWLHPSEAVASEPAAKFSSFGFDLTDLWWNPNESGWGMNIIQQSNTSFATVFVYGAGGSPTWFVAPDLAYLGFDSPTGESVHSGKLYQTSGPAFFAGVFNPGQVGVREVGTLAFRVGLNSTGSTLYRGRVTYTVDGVTVRKDLQRQTWRVANHAGTYRGAIRETWSGCSNPSRNGEFYDYGRVSITQTAELRISFESDDGRFNYVFGGNYVQSGRYGTVPFAALGYATSGGFSDGAVGVGLDIESGVNGIAGAFSFASFRNLPGCNVVIRLTAAR